MSLKSSVGSVLVSVITRQTIDGPVVRWLLDCGRPVDIVCGHHSVIRNRIVQVERFIKSAHDWLFVLDCDTVPVSGTIEALVAASGPNEIHIAPSWMFFTNPTDVLPMAVRRNANGTYSPFAAGTTGIHEVDGAGMSGALFSRDVFQKVGTTFSEGPDGRGGWTTEDFPFWERCQAAGWRIMAHFDLIADHIKTVPLGLLVRNEDVTEAR